MIYNANQFNDLMTHDILHSKYDFLPVELLRCIGHKIKTSLVIGRPTESEEFRLLKDVQYIKTTHGISILLIMEPCIIDVAGPDNTVSLLIPNIMSAKFDNAYPFPMTKNSKWSLRLHNNLIDHAFIESDFSKRGERVKENPELVKLSIVAHRIFLDDSSREDISFTTI